MVPSSYVLLTPLRKKKKKAAKKSLLTRLFGDKKAAKNGQAD